MNSLENETENLNLTLTNLTSDQKLSVSVAAHVW